MATVFSFCVRILGVSAVVGSVGACTAVVDDQDVGEGEQAAGERVATSEQEVIENQYAVGFIPVGDGGAQGGLYGGNCPFPNTQPLSITMDDEDEDNATQWGWSWRAPGDTNPDLRGGAHWNTRFFFCKIDGRLFWPLTTDPFDKSRFYAMLKLGQFCPNGSIEISRNIDNEDDSNANGSGGPIAPNVSGRNTTLRFCFFMSGSTTMPKFPNVGTQYAVYHDFEGSQPVQFQSKAKHYSDDEDDSNQNSTSGAGSAAYPYFRDIISDGPNTTFDLGRVRF